MQTSQGPIQVHKIRSCVQQRDVRSLSINVSETYKLSQQSGLSARKPEKFKGKCRRCGKSGHKQATCRVSQCNFCRRFGHEENKCFKKNPLLNPKSSAETGESNLAEDLVFFCDGSETALTSQKCEVKEHTLVIDSGASSHMFFDRSLLFDFSEETQRKVKNANGTFLQVEGVGKVSLLLLDKEMIERCVTFSDSFSS